MDSNPDLSALHRPLQIDLDFNPGDLNPDLPGELSQSWISIQIVLDGNPFIRIPMGGLQSSTIWIALLDDQDLNPLD